MALKVTGRPDILTQFGPKTQQELVDELYPKEEYKRVEWKEEDKPGLSIDFTKREEEDNVYGFIYNTIRSRSHTQEWLLQLGDNLSDQGTRWETIADRRTAQMQPLQDLCRVAAKRITTTPGAVGLRLSTQVGVQIAINEKGPKGTRLLTVYYKPV